MLLSTGGRKIPCFFILAINVVRFMPNLAAPYGPPITYPAASNAASIKARSESLSVVFVGSLVTCAL